MEEWLKMISPCIRLVGDSGIRPGWVEALRVIYEHELVFFKDSSFEVNIENEIFDCPPDSFIIVPPGKKHISREILYKRGHRYWIHFDWNYHKDSAEYPILTYCPARPKEAFFRKAPAYVPDEIFRGPLKSSRELELFERISNRWNHGDPHTRSTCRGLMLELLLELLSPDYKPLEEQSKGNRLAVKIRNLLDELAEKPVWEMGSIEAALEEKGMSYAHQCRVFKYYYGISPLSYVNTLRMERAKNLLRDTDLTVSETANRLGYNNLGYFSRIFKKIVGVSPGTFRQKV